MQGGSVVFVSSISAFQPSAPLGMYAVSKTALGKPVFSLHSLCDRHSDVVQASEVWIMDCA